MCGLVLTAIRKFKKHVRPRIVFVFARNTRFLFRPNQLPIMFKKPRTPLEPLRGEQFKIAPSRILFSIEFYSFVCVLLRMGLRSESLLKKNRTVFSVETTVDFFCPKTHLNNFLSLEVQPKIKHLFPNNSLKIRKQRTNGTTRSVGLSGNDAETMSNNAFFVKRHFVL